MIWLQEVERISYVTQLAGLHSLFRGNKDFPGEARNIVLWYSVMYKDE